MQQHKILASYWLRLSDPISGEKTAVTKGTFAVIESLDSRMASVC